MAASKKAPAQLELSQHQRLRIEISGLDRGRCRVQLSAVVGSRLTVLDRRDYDSQFDMWRGLADFAANKQADYALAAADARKL